MYRHVEFFLGEEHLFRLVVLLLLLQLLKKMETRGNGEFFMAYGSPKGALEGEGGGGKCSGVVLVGRKLGVPWRGLA